MDIQTLSTLFATTYNPDPNVRKAAELDIRKAARQEGMLAALMQIIGSDSVDLATRQACSVYLKNRMRRSYFLDPANPPLPDQLPVPPSDRQAIKAGIIPLLITSPTRTITVQLANALRSVVSVDFPATWPSLLDDTKRLLNSSQIKEVQTGLIVLLEIIKAFRYRQLDRLTPEIIEQTFPTIVNIGSQLLQSPPPPLTPQSPEIPHLLHLILKIYKSTLISNLSPHQQSAQSIVPWGRLLFSVVNLQIPPDAVPQSEDDRERSEWWKAKKWAYGTLDRLFHRFGSPSQLPTPLKEYLPFAEHFVTAFAPEIIKTYLHQLDLYTSGQVWLSRKCQYLIFQFLTECVKPKSTWALLKDHAESLVSTYVFHQLSFTDTRRELWEADPIDFVRSAIDEYEDYSSPVSSASGFMMSVARNRTKTAFLPILQFINTVLGGNAPPQQRYGALAMTALLAPCMVRHPTVRPELETFLMTHVLREFSAPEAYMRYIACNVLADIAKFDVEWSDENNLSQHFHAVMKALDDPALPVRVAAVQALTALISRHASVKSAVVPLVGKVVQDILKLSDETDLDLLNTAMETMVKHYTAELLPVAAQLTARLCELYQRLVRDTVASQPEEEDDVQDAGVIDLGEDKTYAAMGMAKTILTIVSSLDSSPDILAQLQEIIAPIIVFTLDNLALDLLSNVYDLVDTLTFSLRRIAPCMWPIYELTYKIFKNDAADFLEEMLPCLDNFISFGKEVFIQRPEYRAMAVDIYMTAMTSEHLGENDRVNGCKIAESLLLNLRGQVDDALPTFVTTALKCMEPPPETRYLRIANLSVLVNAVLYNPAMALQILEAQQSTRRFFEVWFGVINSEAGLPRVHARKLSVLAICALLELNPEALKESWSVVVGGVLKILREMPAAVEARKALFEKHAHEEEEEEEEYSIDDLNLEGDADADVWDADSEYMEFLAKEGARLRERAEQPSAGYEANDDDASDDSYEEWAEDELGYISPIDNIDAYVSLKQALTTFQMKNGAVYQAATTSLTVEMQAVLMEAMTIAEHKEKEGARAQLG